MWNVTEIFSLQNDFPVELRLFHVGLYYWLDRATDADPRYRIVGVVCDPLDDGIVPQKKIDPILKKVY